MGMRLNLIGCASLAFGLFAATLPSHAQTARPWVDPPPEGGAASPLSNPQAGEPKPAATRPASPELGTAAQPDEGSTELTRAQTKEASSPPPKSSSRKAAERKERRSVRSAAARSERSRQAVQRRDFAGAGAYGTAEDRIREGRYSGLQVMTLRTIEFPDGRRVQILTRPEPGTLSRFSDIP